MLRGDCHGLPFDDPLRLQLAGPAHNGGPGRSYPDSSCESGTCSGYDGYKRERGSKVHTAVDTLGRLLAVHVTPANEQERVQMFELC